MFSLKPATLALVYTVLAVVGSGEYVTPSSTLIESPGIIEANSASGQSMI